MRNITAGFLIVLAFSGSLTAYAQDADQADTPKTKPKKQKPAPSDFTCSGKRTCGEMNSCKEAYFYLEKCGVGSLDRDKDGVPCESLCK